MTGGMDQITINPASLGPPLPASLQLPYDPASPQYRWAAAELEAVNRTETPWLVVLMHGSPRTTYAESWGLWKVGQGQKVCNSAAEGRVTAAA